MILLINLFEEKFEIKITRVSIFSDLHFLQNIIFLLFYNFMAESKGFEPLDRKFHHWFSRPAH